MITYVCFALMLVVSFVTFVELQKSKSVFLDIFCFCALGAISSYFLKFPTVIFNILGLVLGQYYVQFKKKKVS